MRTLSVIFHNFTVSSAEQLKMVSLPNTINPKIVSVWPVNVKSPVFVVTSQILMFLSIPDETKIFSLVVMPNDNTQFVCPLNLPILKFVLMFK